VLEIALLKPAVAKMIPTDQTLGADFSLSTGSRETAKPRSKKHINVSKTKRKAIFDFDARC
jgi:hypothetical protein